MYRSHPVAVRVVRSLIAFSLLATACAAPAESDEGAADAEAALAQSSCSSAAYADANAHYKTAIAAAKKRLASGDDICDGATVHDIVSEAHRAVNQCAAFSKVIASSRYAKPIRDTLKGNLALPILTRKIEIAGPRGSGAWAGLEESLPGVTVFGPAPGVYGHLSKITFAADGKATFSSLQVSDDGSATWKNVPATYTVGPMLRNDAVQVTVTVQGDAKVYELIPSFSEGALFPGVDFVNTTDPEDVFRSVPEECSA